MNTFNKIALFGLLSVVTVATGVKGAAQAPADAQVTTIVENKFYMVETTAEELDDTQMAAITRKHSGRIFSRNNVEFINVTSDDAGSIDNIETALTNASNKVIYAVGLNKANVATLYACWLVKNGKNSTEAISAAKNISELTDTQKSFIAKYYLTKNAPLLNVLEKAQPVSTKRKLAIRALQAAIALSAVAATVVAGNSYYDANCSTGADTGMCQAAGYANTAAAQAGVYANATAAYAAAGASACGAAATAGLKRLGNLFSRSQTASLPEAGLPEEHSCFGYSANTTQCPNPFYVEPVKSVPTTKPTLPKSKILSPMYPCQDTSFHTVTPTPGGCAQATNSNPYKDAVEQVAKLLRAEYKASIKQGSMKTAAAQADAIAA